MLSVLRLRSKRRAAQRGLSIVEMMVGIAVGLIVVAGASLVVSSQLGDNRRLLTETQLQQDMRATMDVIARELRRMGAQREAPALAGIAANPVPNPMAWPLATVAGSPVSTLEFQYQPTLGADTEFGFRLDGDGVVRSKIGMGLNARWQELTDPFVLKVTHLDITPTHSSLLTLPCPKLCPDGSTDCWPQVMVRDLKVVLKAVARSASGVERTLDGRVRVRNDVVKFNVSPTEVCPA